MKKKTIKVGDRLIDMYFYKNEIIISVWFKDPISGFSGYKPIADYVCKLTNKGVFQ